MSDPQHPLESMLRKFERRSALEAADRAAVRALAFTQQAVPPNGYVVREGERAQRCAVILSGMAYRHKTTAGGERQILSVHMPGDMVDLQGSLLNIADHNVQALTPCEMVFIDRAAIRKLIVTHPLVGMAMWVDTLVDGSIFREWILNIGRRDGRGRIAHLLCELGSRFAAAGLAPRDDFELPMTQEQIGDAVGLTPVHVNRVLKAMTEDELIRRERHAIRIPDWRRLAGVAGFNELYLHLDQAAA